MHACLLSLRRLLPQHAIAKVDGRHQAELHRSRSSNLWRLTMPMRASDPNLTLISSPFLYALAIQDAAR
jgi:hypothetical protein